jgi:hypothetical protein
MPIEDHLPDDLRDFYLGLRDNPEGLLEALRQPDQVFLLAIAEADTAPMLRQWFSERGIVRAESGWEHDPHRTGRIGESAVGVEWRWTGVHDDGGDQDDDGGPTFPSFNSLPPSGNEVTVHGFTLFGIELDHRGEPLAAVRRYVDWAGVFAQLGLTLNWRTPV